MVIQRSFNLPGIVRAKAAVVDKSGTWADTLPELVADLERQWSVHVTEQLFGGTSAFVARVRTAAGGAAVMKVAVPDHTFSRQVQALERAAGHGYVQVLAHDPDRSAVLLEALGPSLDQMGYSPERQLRTLCTMLKQAWMVRSVAGTATLPLINKAQELHAFVLKLWEELDDPCPQRVVEQALDYAQQRASRFHPGRCVVVHGDAAPSHALQVLTPRDGAEAGFVFVDPDGFLGDPAYDLGVALRDWNAELSVSKEPGRLARHYCRVLAASSGVSENAIWQWGFLERVSTGLYALSLGAEDLGRPFLRSAEGLADPHWS